MSIKISDTLKTKLNEWKDDSGEVKLPFDAPVFWVLNGSAQYKPLAKQSPALYFGGLACSASEFETLGVDLKGAVKHEFTPRGAEQSIEIYSTRHLLIAPICRRLSSTEKATGIRYPGYHKGASPNLQMIAYLAERNAEKVIAPLCPIVITIKGFQVGYVLDALREFSSKTSKARKQFADGLRAEMFYCALGTFGDKFVSKMVGSGNKQSPITPLTAFVPETIDEKFIDSFFVGAEMVQVLTDLRDQANDWLGAWKEVKADKVPQSNGFEIVAPEEPPNQEFDE